MLGSIPSFVDLRIVFSPEDASVRAERCLRAHLSPVQLEDYLARKRFRVRGSHSGDIYHIMSGRTNNVIRQRGEYAKAYCSVPDAIVPLADQLLIQKLYLETNEALFLEHAASAGAVYLPTGVL